MTERGRTIRSSVLLGLVASLMMTASMVVVFFVVEQQTPASRVESQFEMLDHALKSFYDDYGRYPTDKEGLWILEDPSKSGIAYLTQPPLDPWRRNFEYRNRGEGADPPYLLFSKGNDGISSTDGFDPDDIRRDHLEPLSSLKPAIMAKPVALFIIVWVATAAIIYVILSHWQGFALRRPEHE